MPVYNAEKYLRDSINSILNQTFTEFELLMMDDGSTDGSRKILDEYAKKDGRIKIFSQKNQGIVKSLNSLAKEAKADLIGRMDADDLAYPTRLETQYNYLKTHPHTVLLGTSCVVFREDTKKTSISDTFAEDLLNRWFLTLNCGFRHCTIIFKKKTFEECGGYLESEYPAEDYGLWIRMQKYGDIENLNDVLGEARMIIGSVSGKNFRKQIKVRNRLNAANFEIVYKDGTIPTIEQIEKSLRTYVINNHRRHLFAKLACLTGCFLVQKGELKRAAKYFWWSIKTSKKRFDALANLLLCRFGRAFYVSLDAYVKIRTITPSIRWFKNR